MNNLLVFRSLKLIDTSILIVIWVAIGFIISYLVSETGIINREKFWTGEDMTTLRETDPVRYRVYLGIQIFSCLLLFGLAFRVSRGLVVDYYVSPFEDYKIGKDFYQTRHMRELYQVVVVTFVLFSTQSTLKEMMLEFGEFPSLPHPLVSWIVLIGATVCYISSKKIDLETIHELKLQQIRRSTKHVL